MLDLGGGGGGGGGGSCLIFAATMRKNNRMDFSKFWPWQRDSSKNTDILRGTCIEEVDTHEI